MYKISLNSHLNFVNVCQFFYGEISELFISFTSLFCEIRSIFVYFPNYLERTNFTSQRNKAMLKCEILLILKYLKFLRTKYFVKSLKPITPSLLPGPMNNVFHLEKQIFRFFIFVVVHCIINPCISRRGHAVEETGRRR